MVYPEGKQVRFSARQATMHFYQGGRLKNVTWQIVFVTFLD
ncbi:hypothetical protein SAMN05216327_109233 [Dyadobacter sp. SG02]|nr:hypothetical protein SAMN05216327_109233 [Dyadobacter sp. SG02]